MLDPAEGGRGDASLHPSLPGGSMPGGSMAGGGSMADRYDPAMADPVAPAAEAMAFAAEPSDPATGSSAMVDPPTRTTLNPPTPPPPTAMPPQSYPAQQASPGPQGPGHPAYPGPPGHPGPQ